MVPLTCRTGRRDDAGPGDRGVLGEAAPEVGDPPAAVGDAAPIGALERGDVSHTAANATRTVARTAAPTGPASLANQPRRLPVPRAPTRSRQVG